MNLNEKLDTIGEPGTAKRLEAIASMNLGERSEAATRVLDKRNRRRELMDMGLSFSAAASVIAVEFQKE